MHNKNVKTYLGFFLVYPEDALQSIKKWTRFSKIYNAPGGWMQVFYLKKFSIPGGYRMGTHWVSQEFGKNIIWKAISFVNQAVLSFLNENLQRRF
jgi:hypothetical protein